MQVQSEFVLNTSHDYQRTNRSLYIGNITSSRLSLPRTEMALRALPCGKILYLLMFILTALLLNTSHDYKRTNRSLYIGNITSSRLSLPRTEMALRAL